MTYLPDLKRQLVDAVPAAPGSRRGSRWRGRGRALRGVRLVVVLALVLALLTAVALAASGVIEIGSPVKTPSYAPSLSTPDRGMGAVVPGSVRLLVAGIPDPAGGPPWGMRAFKTTRGLECVQVGRVVDGRLGLLGQDGIAGDDGRFHPLPLRVLDQWDCAPGDARGHAFIAITQHDAYASGPSGSRRCSMPGEHDPHKTTRCPAADQRLLVYGLLGPAARQLTYRGADRRDRAIAPSRPDGAYLIVLPDRARLGGIGVGTLPGGPPVRSYRYDNGLVCRASGPRCGPVGYVAPRPPHVTPAEVRAPITVHVSHGQRDGVAITGVELTFAAPVAITNAATSYVATAQLPAACGGTMFSSGSTANLRRGARVRIRLGVPVGARCHGRVSGRVELQTPTGKPSAGLILPPTLTRSSSLTVGTFSVPIG